MSQLGFESMFGTSRDPSADPDRGSWCTPREYAEAVGLFDLDPFTNPRSWVRAVWTCMLERADNGIVPGAMPGWFLGRRWGAIEGAPLAFSPREAHASGIAVPQNELRQATEQTRVWIQPDYGFVLDAIRHYGHTRFTALLRLDTSTQWFDELHALSQVIMVPRGDRLAFEPPPGVKASSNPFPHGLFYKHVEDVTPEIWERCYEWPIRRNLPPLYFTTEPTR